VAESRRQRDEISRERANAYCYGVEAGVRKALDHLRLPRLPDGLLNGAVVQSDSPIVELLAIPERTLFLEEVHTVHRLRFRRVKAGHIDEHGLRVEWTTWEPADRPQAIPVSS